MRIAVNIYTKALFIWAVTFFSMVSCAGGDQNEKEQTAEAGQDTVGLFVQLVSNGESVFKNNCATCHCGPAGSCEGYDAARQILLRTRQDSARILLDAFRDSSQFVSFSPEHRNISANDNERTAVFIYWWAAAHRIHDPRRIATQLMDKPQTQLTSTKVRCMNTGLSKTYNFITETERFTGKHELDSSVVTTTVVLKKDSEQIFQNVILTTWLFDSSYVACGNVRSYTTGINRNKEVIDNDYGDIIVADFNFDGQEDFALKLEEGGNGGPVYTYYMYNNRRFSADPFLTDSIGYFPERIDPVKKILRTRVHASAVSVCVKTFQLDRKTSTWKQISTKFEGY